MGIKRDDIYTLKEKFEYYKSKIKSQEKTKLSLENHLDVQTQLLEKVKEIDEALLEKNNAENECKLREQELQAEFQEQRNMLEEHKKAILYLQRQIRLKRRSCEALWMHVRNASSIILENQTEIINEKPNETSDNEYYGNQVVACPQEHTPKPGDRLIQFKGADISPEKTRLHALLKVVEEVNQNDILVGGFNSEQEWVLRWLMKSDFKQIHKLDMGKLYVIEKN